MLFHSIGIKFRDASTSYIMYKKSSKLMCRRSHKHHASNSTQSKYDGIPIDWVQKLGLTVVFFYKN